MSETRILVRLLQMYFLRNWEFSSALSELWNFRGRFETPPQYATARVKTLDCPTESLYWPNYLKCPWQFVSVFYLWLYKLISCSICSNWKLQIGLWTLHWHCQCTSVMLIQLIRVHSWPCTVWTNLWCSAVTPEGMVLTLIWLSGGILNGSDWLKIGPEVSLE
jgi:hypothetical protein